MPIFDTVIIGTGPSSEPVLHHLAKSKLNCCVIDAGDIGINIPAGKIKKKYDFYKNLTPKQKLNGFFFSTKNYFNKLNSFLYLKSKGFTYVYSFSSGGLSNIWGGGVFEWPDYELRKTSSLPSKSIKDAYQSIKAR